MTSLSRIIYTDTVPPEQTALEVAFIERMIPLETHPRLLDLGCEGGRHSVPLAADGYRVTGLDNDPRALEVARLRANEAGVEVEWLDADMHAIGSELGPFDGVILFWQSFGFFDSAAQSGLFSMLHRIVRADGIMILDLYNRLYFTREVGSGWPPVTLPVEPTATWTETVSLTGITGFEDDMKLQLRSPVELLDPHLYSIGEITGIAASHGFELIVACSGYDPASPATPDEQKMQLVFRRSESRKSE